MGPINALAEVFPRAQINGCYFHLMQNLKKTLAKVGLKNRYEMDPEFATKCSRSLILIFLFQKG